MPDAAHELPGQDWYGRTLASEDASRVEFIEADLTGTKFVGAIVTSCYLSGATMHRADFTDCDLRGSDLTTLDPISTSLRGAVITTHQAEVLVETLRLQVRE